jgi:hypothetical protein
MRHLILIATIALLIPACAGAPQKMDKNRADVSLELCSTSSEASKGNLDTQCHREAPAALAATFGEFRLAQPQDFVPVIQQLQTTPTNGPKPSYTCSLFTANFNQDEQPDYAVLLVNPQTQTSQFRLVLGQGQNSFTDAVVRDYA